MAYIEVNNLKYRYPLADTLALKRVSFSVSKGEFIGIIGASGSGKTSLCYALAGIIPTLYKGAYGGSIHIDGDVVGQTADIVRKTSVGIVLQEPWNQMTGAKGTVYEEIAFGLENQGIDRAIMHQKINEIMQLLQIEDISRSHPLSISGGEAQKVALASMIVMEPDVLILDEPTSQLDPQTTQEIFHVIELLQMRGVTILMVEHKMDYLAAYAHKILLLDQGSVLDFAPPKTIFALPDIEDKGIEVPVYTKICQMLDLTMQDGSIPITACEALAILNTGGR